MYLIINNNNEILSYSNCFVIVSDEYGLIEYKGKIPEDFEEKKYLYDFDKNLIIPNKEFKKEKEDEIDLISELKELQNNFYSYVFNNI